MRSNKEQLITKWATEDTQTWLIHKVKETIQSQIYEYPSFKFMEFVENL